MSVERVVLDTSVLLAAVDTARAAHQSALRLLEGDERSLAIAAQSMREFLVGATRPADQNGLGMGGPAAVSNILELTSGLDVLHETAESRRRLLGFVGLGTVAGKQVHDANLVAVALSHGSDVLVTDNITDFRRFSDVIVIEPLVKE